MAIQQSELSPVELESFADKSKRVCLFKVMRGDKMMAEKVNLQTAEQPRLWTCFRCEAVFHQEIHLHYHQSYIIKKRQRKLQTFEYEARNSIKDDFYRYFFTLK